MDTIEDQLRHLNDMCGFVDESDQFRGSKTLSGTSDWSEQDMVVKSDTDMLLSHHEGTAQYVAWVKWFVNTACATPLKVEDRNILRGNMEQKLPSLKNLSLRECCEKIVAQIINEMSGTVNVKMRNAIAKLPADKNPSVSLQEKGGAVMGGNWEGMQFVAESLCTLFEHPLAGDNVRVQKQAMQLGTEVRDGLHCHMALQKVLDALVFTQCQPLAVDIAGQNDKPRLRLRDEIVTYAETLAPLFRKQNSAEFPSQVVSGLTVLAEQRGQSGDGIGQYIDRHLESSFSSTKAAYDASRHEIESARFSASPQERLGYVGIVSLNHLMIHAKSPRQSMLGCPLSYTGNFGKWYRFVTMPITEWYRTQR